MMDKRREAFYEWYDREVAPNITGCRAVIFAMCEKGWDAALDSVVIELPCLSRSQYANQHSFNCAEEALGCAKGAIEAAGLKVKP